jgi:hypothetical protein
VLHPLAIYVTAVGTFDVGQLEAFPDPLQLAMLAGYRVVIQFNVILRQFADDDLILGQLKDLELIINQVF